MLVMKRVSRSENLRRTDQILLNIDTNVQDLAAGRTPTKFSTAFMLQNPAHRSLIDPSTVNSLEMAFCIPSICLQDYLTRRHLHRQVHMNKRQLYTLVVRFGWVGLGWVRGACLFFTLQKLQKTCESYDISRHFRCSCYFQSNHSILIRSDAKPY